MDAYRELEIRRITIHAGLSGGGYAWARFGFRPTESEWRSLRDELRTRANRLDRALSEEARRIVGLALSDDSPEAIWEIADLDEVIEGKKLGRTLLEGTGWEGFLNLEDRDSMDRFNAYVARAR
jgi:hypothetical protein